MEDPSCVVLYRPKGAKPHIVKGRIYTDVEKAHRHAKILRTLFDDVRVLLLVDAPPPAK